MADEPLIAWNNLADGAVILAENGASESGGLPLGNLYSWDNLRPAVITPVTTSLELLIGFAQPIDAADVVIMGAARHDASGNRTQASTVSLDGHAGSGVLTNLVNGATVAKVNSASLHKFTKTTIAPDTFANRTTPTIAPVRSRWLHGRFFTCGANGTAAAISYADGLGNNATAATITDAAIVNDMAWDGASNLIAVGSTGNAYTSVDSGLNWTNSVIAAAVNIGSIAYGNGLYIACPSAAGTTVYTSPDAVTWTAQTIAASMTNKIVSFGNGVFTMVGDGGLIQTTSDGVTWTAQTSGTANNITDVVYGSAWVAVTAAGESLTSADAVTWVLTASIGAATACTHITFADNEYKAGATVAVSALTVIRSSDGITWTSEASGVIASTIASNGVSDIVEDNAAGTIASVKVIKSAYRLTITGLAPGSPFLLPELFLGPRLDMPFVDYNYDPYIEKFKGNVFEAESGRQFVTLHYRRLELKPSWSMVPTVKSVEVDVFREDHLELRKPFWYAWRPDTTPLECYMMRHKAESATMPIKTAVHRSFKLDLIEAL